MLDNILDFANKQYTKEAMPHLMGFTFYLER